MWSSEGNKCLPVCNPVPNWGLENTKGALFSVLLTTRRGFEGKVSSWIFCCQSSESRLQSSQTQNGIVRSERKMRTQNTRLTSPRRDKGIPRKVNKLAMTALRLAAARKAQRADEALSLDATAEALL